MKKIGLFSLILSLQYFVIVSVFSFEAVTAQDQQTADSLLSDKVAELNRFVGVVEANAHNCDALAGCSGPKNCSRISCYKYGAQGDPNYKCLEVNNNTICGAHCQHLRNFDYTRSFVRLVDKLDLKRTAPTVCIHKTLDVHFKTSSMNDSTHFFRAFFGAVDGTFRIYPGADEPDCKEDSYDPKDRPVYDPRFRPWFVESTYVEKAVAVLIDTGSDMRNSSYGNILPGTHLDKAVSMALRFLDTLSVVERKEDYVNIMAFSGNGNYSWLNTFQKYNESQHYQNFNESLDRRVRDTSSDVSSKTSAPDISNSINTAISELNNSNSIPENYLKVVIVLTGGTQFQNLSELNITANTSVNVFVYKFITDGFITDGAAPECSPGPAIRASSEVIPHKRLNNPLYALHSYYSFLAKVHKSVNKSPNLTDYGPTYQDFSGIDNSTLTLSKAAFDPNGELIGVLGIDFHQKKLDLQYPNIRFQAIVDSASREPSVFDTKYLSVNVCFTPYILEDHCPRLDTSSVQLCQLSTRPGGEKIGCCGDCKKDLWKKIVGGVVGGVVGLLALAAIVWLIRRWFPCRTRDNGEHPVFPPFPGTG